MKRLDKNQIEGIIGTVAFHAIVLVVLLLVVIQKPQQQQEEGVTVMMGNVVEAGKGMYEFTEVKVAPKPARTSATPVQSKAQEPMITQTEEPTVEIPSAPKGNKEKPKQKTAQEEAAEKAAQEAERQRIEAERIAREASERISSAFAKGNKNLSNSEEENNKEGNQGSTTGNQKTGITEGIGGYGTFDLSGRSLGKGGLPRPEYNVQDEGRVVVNITVSPEGRVVKTSINSRTNTMNQTLRSAALKAASQAVFNAVGGVNNQMGTITYYFTLR